MAYSWVERRVWTDERFRQWDHVKRLAWLYLLTGPWSSTRLGCYVLDPMYLAADLEIEPARADGLLDEFEDEGRIVRDPAVRLVLVCRHLKHTTLDNPNVVTAAIRELEELPYSGPVFRALLCAVENYGRDHYAPLAGAIRSRLDERNADSEGTRVDKGDSNGSDNGSPNGMANTGIGIGIGTGKGTNTTSSERTRENDGEGVENSVSEIIIEANRGLSENRNLDRPARPIPTGHASRADVLDWLEEGIDPEFAAERVRAIARDYRPAQPKQQIHSMAYFSGAVREAWDERKQAEVKARLDELDREQKAREREARSRELPPDPPPMREPKRENQLESVSAFTERYIGRAEA